MAYSEVFERKCTVTAAYYTFTKNNTQTSGCDNYTNSGCSNHTDTGYSNHSNSYSDDYYYGHSDDGGCSNHYNSYFNNYSESGYAEYIYQDDYGSGYSCSDYHTDCADYSCSDYGCNDCDDYYCSDLCSNSYSESGCSTHSNSGYSNHTNTYVNNSAAYTNCSVKWHYVNYADASNTNTGVARTLTWPSSFTSNGFVADNVKDTINAMKAVYDNIKDIAANKGRNKVSVQAVESSMSDFSDGQVAADTTVAGECIESIRTVLNNLNKDLLQTSTELPTNLRFSRLSKNTMSTIKSELDNIAKTVVSYTNYLNSSYANSSQGSTSNSLYIDNVTGTTPAAPYKDITEIRNS